MIRGPVFVNLQRIAFCLSFLALATIDLAQAEKNAETPSAQPSKKYDVIAERSHKTQSFTQGLFILDGYFYESSGLYKKSFIAKYPIEEPQSTWAKLSAPYVLKKNLPDELFAEGATHLGKDLFVLTWQEHKILQYRLVDFSFVQEIELAGEGWGLTTDGKSLIRSDGSNQLSFHNPSNLQIERTIKVTLDGKAMEYLNELEYAKGYLWANVWHQNLILKISPTDGKVVNFWDLTQLSEKLSLKDTESVLNGIAFDPNQQAFWVTGKNWPKLYLIRFED